MENLVRQAMKQHKESFTKLIHLHLQTMYKTAYSMLSNDEDAADAIQDTILTCWEKLNQLEEPKYFKTWMTRILINKCNDILRKKQRFVLLETIPEEPTTDNMLAGLEWNDIMSVLSPKEQIVITLYYSEGFKTTEIARMLDITETAVRNRLARGRDKIAARYYPEIEKEQAK